MATFIAFLRAVNVGKRQVKMAGLRSELEANGFTDVATFIASGNVRVSTTMRSAGKVEEELEQVMEAWSGSTSRPWCARQSSCRGVRRRRRPEEPHPGQSGTTCRSSRTCRRPRPPKSSSPGTSRRSGHRWSAARRTSGWVRAPEAHQRHDGEDPRNSRYGPRLEDGHQARRDLGFSLIESAQIIVIWTGCTSR